MASYNEHHQQQEDADRDLDDWLHLTGWHNVADRNAKLAQFRDIHFDYETRRRDLMRGTFDNMSQDPYEAQNMETTGNENLAQRPQQQQFTLPLRPAPGAPHHDAGLSGPAGPAGPAGRPRPAIPTGPSRPAVSTGPRRRERSHRSHSPVLRGRSPGRGRNHARGGARGGGRAGGAAGNYRQRDYPEQTPRVIHPIKDVDLGDWDAVAITSTRFFMIKSTDSRNIFTCQDDNIWATSSVEKGNVLADAYMTTKNVILFFSANGSHAIQGYARMIGPPSGNIAKPEWYYHFSREMSEPFPVEWLSKNTCTDRPMKGLLNRLNRDDQPGGEGAFLPPTRSRDCQEIDGQCGRDMIEILKRNAESAAAGAAAARAG
ncbi:hypothetical protein PG993_005636 [Apiospora rasikravindrae]|uniref:YTH domain-containing protein n=1 Tax=Apiospora rasikravindrae TaxID=990691 RepID=A0ABR1TG85_9PEZI